MADETETPEPEEKPKRRRRRRKPSEEGPEATSPSEATASSPSEDDVTPEAEQPDAETEAPTPQPQEAPESEPAPAADEKEEPEAQSEPDEREPTPRAPRRAAPSRRRDRREPTPGPPPVVRAQAKYVRSSARKARFVCDHIRGKSVEDARAILALAPRAVARDWSKLLESAVANAEHNHELVGEDLYVKAVQADEGPTIKRYRPRALGRATRIRKRTSHLTILLTPKD